MIKKVLGVTPTKENDFFSLWIEYLAPRHHLTKSEQKFLAACIRQRFELSKGISDETLLDETCLNETYRSKIRQELGISVQQMQNVIVKLKKQHILIPRTVRFSDKLSYYKIAPDFIPPYKEDEDFLLILLFKKPVKDDRETDIGASSQGVQSAEADN